MSSTEILTLLAKKTGAYILDDIGTGEIVLREANGSDMKLVDDDGREISPRFPYALIEGLIQQRYVAQDQNNRRIYRISNDGLRAAHSWLLLARAREIVAGVAAPVPTGHYICGGHLSAPDWASGQQRPS